VKRWWLAIALLLSVGVNVGILAVLAVSRLTARPDAATSSPAAPVAAAGDARSPASAAAEAPAPAAASPPEAAPRASPAKDVTGSGAGSTGAEPAAPAPPASERPPPGAQPPRPSAPDKGSPSRSGKAPAPPESAGAEPTSPLPPAPRLEQLADDLGLAGETRSRFIALQRRMFISVVTTERRRRVLQMELHRQLMAPRPDEERIGELIRRQAGLVAEMEQITARAILESRALLTPEQEKRYLEVVGRLRPRLLEEALRRRSQPARPGAGGRPLRPFRRPR
jgi:hypothetical protein